MKTLVLLSGGIDSAVVLAGALADGDEVACCAFNYGQQHKIELNHAVNIAHHYNLDLNILDLPEMPKVNDVVFAGRNLVMVAHAIAWAQAHKFDRIAVGCNSSDWVQFPDCRPNFWNALRNCAEAYGIRIATPLIHSTKRDVVAAARKLGVPLELTWSCYGAGPEPCGECLACEIRRDALEWSLLTA